MSAQLPAEREDESSRPAVSILAPFAGDPAGARALIDALSRVRLAPGDEIVVADNSEEPVVATVAGAGPIRVVAATAERSSYFARNTAAEHASNHWLLFVDADCAPAPTILDDYFRAPIDSRCGVIAGGVVGERDEPGVLAEWARSRRLVSELHLTEPSGRLPHRAGGTPNLLVRRATWESLGGFHEGVRSGADMEFCWRAQDAGWEFDHRPEAEVEHHYGTTLRHTARDASSGRSRGGGAIEFIRATRGVFRQSSRHATGRLWACRRYPGAFERPKLVRPLGRCAAGAAGWPLLGQPKRGLFKAIDAVAILGSASGWYFGTNEARPGASSRRPAGERADVVVFADAFPARSETFVHHELAALRRDGHRVRVESAMRPANVERGVARSLEIAYLESEPPRAKAWALARLIARHPVACWRDRRARSGWSAEENPWPLSAIATAALRVRGRGERRVHAHFAAGNALTALRIARILGLDYSLTAHAFDIFQRPRNLIEKLEAAAFVAAECDYTTSYLHDLLPPPERSKVHCVRTGVDAAEFHRRTPYPGGRTVVAIGRLVEKKGFPYLVDALALLGDRCERALIAGEGPLREEIEARIQRHGLEDRVTMVGNVWGPRVRDFLEEADLLVIPSVPASDGDRDALPVVSYEALAMQVPVVASEFVGLPEVVRPEWGRLVPPGDVEALARAIGELLDLPAAERQAMGAAARDAVLAEWQVRHGARRLAVLLGLQPAGEQGRSEHEGASANRSPRESEEAHRIGAGVDDGDEGPLHADPQRTP